MPLVKPTPPAAVPVAAPVPASSENELGTIETVIGASVSLSTVMPVCAEI